MTQNQHPIDASTLPEGTAGTFTSLCPCGAAVRVVDSVEQPHDHVRERIEVVTGATPAPSLRDRISKVLNEHMCERGYYEGEALGKCAAADCTFEGHQQFTAAGLPFGAYVGPDEEEQQAGHQADLLLPIIEEEVAARAAQETKMAREANRAAIKQWNRADAAEAVIARVRARHTTKRLHPSGPDYCTVCFTDGGYDGALPVLYPCPEIEALDDTHGAPVLAHHRVGAVERVIAEAEAAQAARKAMGGFVHFTVLRAALDGQE